jgi:hypothetical protein
MVWGEEDDQFWVKLRDSVAGCSDLGVDLCTHGSRWINQAD